MASSGLDDVPNKMVGVVMPKGIEVPSCWCDDVCKLKESQEYSYTFGRRFFMCPNYNSYLPKSGAYEFRPSSPSPICDFIDWLDKEQSTINKEIVMHELEWRREIFYRRLREEEEVERRKIWQENQCKKKKEHERRAEEAREAERTRKWELARRAKEEEKDDRKKEKYPR